MADTAITLRLTIADPVPGVHYSLQQKDAVFDPRIATDAPLSFDPRQPVRGGAGVGARRGQGQLALALGAQALTGHATTTTRRRAANSPPPERSSIRCARRKSEASVSFSTSCRHTS